MKDFLGNELKVGDKVVCLEKDYKNLIHATVVKLTEKTIFVEFTRRAFPGVDRTETVKRFSDQVIKI